jgi:hypothetical protein
MVEEEFRGIVDLITKSSRRAENFSTTIAVRDGDVITGRREVESMERTAPATARASDHATFTPRPKSVTASPQKIDPLIGSRK